MNWWSVFGRIGQDLIDGVETATDRASATLGRTVLGAAQNAAVGLDQAIDRAAAAMDQNVLPFLQDVAGRIDQTIDKTLHRNDPAASDEDAMRRQSDHEEPLPLLDWLHTLDQRYQQFMVQRIDPLFGQIRTQHLQELGSLEVSDQELELNRHIAYSGLALVTLVGGQLLAPPTLLITVPASFTMMLPVFKRAVDSVQKQRRVTYHVVSAINATAIWVGGYYVPALGLTMASHLGEKLLMVTEDRSQKGLIAVFSQQPRVVTVLESDQEIERPLQDVTMGSIVIVGAGGFMPVDGEVVEGLGLVDQHMLTGEAKPAEKAAGDQVYASTIVLAGKLYVKVSCAGDETVAAKIGNVLNQTASYQLALQSKGSKICHDFALPTLLMSGLALATLGPESSLAVLNSAFGATVRLSSPVTMLNLLNIASQNAILLKDGRSLDLLAEVDTVVFDKTGTLTLTRPTVTQIVTVEDGDATQLLALAAAAERGQSHPIAIAIVAEAEERGVDIPEIDHAHYEIGYGIKIEMGELAVRVGSDRFMALEGIDLPPDILAAQTAGHRRGNSMVMVAVDGQLAGVIELEPTIRPEADEVLHALRQRGLDLVVISGDQEEPTRNLAERLGMDRYFANVLPEGKASLVEQLQKEGHVVCFVGDGINDSIALKRSNVSVSLRGATTVATDSAQIVLMQESLCQLPFLFELGNDMEQSMKLGFLAGIIPGMITVSGVFLLSWGYLPAFYLNLVGLTFGLGAAMYPLYKYRRLSSHLPELASPPESIPTINNSADPDSRESQTNPEESGQISARTSASAIPIS